MIGRVASFAAMLALVAAGCQSSPSITAAPPTDAPHTGSPTPAVGSPTETAASPEPSPVSTIAGASLPASAIPVVVGSGELMLSSTNIGLADLASYNATLTQSFAGTEAGQPANWSITSVMVDGGKDVGRHFTVATNGDNAPADPTDVWERNAVIYRAADNENCSGRQAEDDELLSATSEPASLLPAVVGADGAGEEDIDGVTASHFTFDQRAIGLDGLADASGELWLAIDGGYLVRYRLTITGGSEYFGPAGQGTLTYDYQLSDVNLPLDIGLPAECPAGLIDAPVPAAATNVLTVPGFLQYDSTASMGEALAYYQDQAEALGWTLIVGPLTSDTATLIAYSTSKGPLSILATQTDTGATVSITFGDPTQP